MYGKTREQVKKRLKISIVVAAVMLIIMLGAMYYFGSKPTWGFILLLIFIGYPGWVLEILAVTLDWKLFLNMIVKPLKTFSNHSLIMAFFIFAPISYIKHLLMPLVVGVKAIIYMSSGSPDDNI